MFLVILVFLVSKGAVLLKALKALKFAKYGITMITMSISAILYGFAFGSWYFAVGFVLLLFVHEWGHVLGAQQKGVAASAPVFIPFLGAAIFAEMPSDKGDEAYIGYAGPLIGTIGALLCILVAFAFPEGSFWNKLFHLLGNVGLFINLFNLIPARPLDGGRILHPLGDWVPYVGFILLGVMALVLHDIFFVLLMLLATDNFPIRSGLKLALFGAFFLVSAGVTLIAPDVPTWWMYTWVTVSLCVSIALFFVAFSHRSNWEIDDTEAVGGRAANDEQMPPVRVRILWLVAYLALLAGILATMSWHTQYMPHEVQNSNLIKTIG